MLVWSVIDEKKKLELGSHGVEWFDINGQQWLRDAVVFTADVLWHVACICIYNWIAIFI